MAKTKASWWWLGTIATVVAIAIALGVVLGLGLTNNDSDSSASISELTGERKNNAFAAAANVRQVAMIPPEGVASAEDSQARRRLLEAVTPVDVGAFASDSDYSKAPKATMYVDSLTKEVFQLPSMVLCFMSSTNWTKNLNTGPYIAEIDPYHCDNPDGERIKGQITYRWVVESTGPDLDDENDPLDEFKGHVWVTITDDPDGPMEIDTRLIIKRSDVVVKGDDLFIKKLTFQYQSDGMKGIVIKEVEIGDNDSKPTAEGIKFYQRYGDDEQFFEPGAVSRTEYDANGIATSTKAAFKEVDFRDFPDVSYINGYMVTSDSLAKLQFRGQEYCDQLHNRSFLGDRYAAFDDSGEKSHIVSFVNLQATGSDDEIYQAFMHYPGNLYVSEYSDTGRMEDSAIAIATAAFADGKTVTQVVDWNDPSKNLNRVLKFSRGVLYKIEPTIQPVTNYMDTIIQGWFWDEETYDSVMVKIKYDSDTSTLMLLSKQIYECTSDTCDLGLNTITTPRALSMDDIGNNPIECWGSFGQTGATLLNLTHYKVASSVPVKAGELDADLTLTCGERCADASSFATVSDHDGLFYEAPNGYSDDRTTYKTYTLNKDTVRLTEDGVEVVFDASNPFFDSSDVFMTLFEASTTNYAAMSCPNEDDVCQRPQSLDVYYEWRSSRWTGMSWLVDPDTDEKTFMDAPLSLHGELPVHPRSLSGTDYAGLNVNLQYEGGWINGLPMICIDIATGERRIPDVDQWGNSNCDWENNEHMSPDVMIPDGTTFRDAVNDEKYVLKLESGVEVLQRVDLEDCGAMEYDTSLTLPTSDLYEAFEMPTKPGPMINLTVRGDDKLM
jgi:hypothetical protein